MLHLNVWSRNSFVGSASLTADEIMAYPIDPDGATEILLVIRDEGKGESIVYSISLIYTSIRWILNFKRLVVLYTLYWSRFRPGLSQSFRGVIEASTV